MFTLTTAFQLVLTLGERNTGVTSMNRELQQRLARQLAEANPGTVVRIGDHKEPAQGEREKMS